ncbi:MAG: transporter substrate-binding protein [Paenibacillus sp.]|nr:transporter substrate-binding protein [Paenibacillus sp.]
MKKMLTLLAAILIVTATGCQSTVSNDSVKDQSDKPVTISIIDKDIQPDDKLLKGIEDGMKADGKNVKLQLVQVQSGNYAQSLGLQLQSGNIPDLIYFQGGDYQFAITQKILEDLTPFIQKSTYVKASMTPFNLERTKNYPYLVWLSPTDNVVPVIRQEWLNKTVSGKDLLANPTIENYYNFFKEVKEKNSAKFTYTTAGNLDELDAVFGQAFGLTSTWIKGSDGQYVFGKTTSFEKNKLEYYAKMFKDGLLDPEFLTKKFDTKEKAFYDGQAAIIAGRQGGSIDFINRKMITQNGDGSKIIPLPPAKGIGQAYSPVDVTKESRGFAIAKTSKNKDMAFAVLEFLASPKGQMLDKFGVEGEQYNIVNNKIKFTDKFAEWFPRFVNNAVNFKPDKEVDPSTPYISEAAIKSMDLVSSFATKDNSFIIPEELATQWDACNKLYQEFAANMVLGKKTSADFDKFVQDWNAAGGKQITEYANKTIK